MTGAGVPSAPGLTVELAVIESATMVGGGGGGGEEHAARAVTAVPARSRETVRCMLATIFPHSIRRTRAVISETSIRVIPKAGTGVYPASPPPARRSIWVR